MRKEIIFLVFEIENTLVVLVILKEIGELMTREPFHLANTGEPHL